MSKFDDSLNNLNQGQRQAVETIEGPVMVVAGPGTGKTQILALRIANILRQTDFLPQNILCLTFTEAGVKAMRERLTRFIGADAYKVAIHTFHSFSNEIIQRYSEKFAFAKELIQLDDLNRIKIVQSIIDELDDPNKKLTLIPFHNKYARQWDIISAIQTLKKENIKTTVLKQKALEIKKQHEENPVLNKKGKPTRDWENKLKKTEVLLELTEIYENYQRKLTEQGLYDYEDMIMFVIDKFKTDENLLLDQQERYQYILVDEYQDTNGSQNEIIKLLGSHDSNPNIFVVGDDDQAIYRFQGANLGNILFFGRNFREVKTIPTLTNYRSTQLILDIADSLILNNVTRLTNEIKDLEKKLKAFKSHKGDQAEVWEFNNSDEENIFISKEILKLKQQGVNYSDIAILYRKNAHAEDINEMLNKFEIPTKIDSSTNIFDIEIIKQLINLLKCIHLFEKNSDRLFYEVLSYGFLNIPIVEVYKLTRKASEEKKRMMDLMIEIIENSSIDDENPIKKFINKIFEWHKLQNNIPLNRLIEIVINESGLLKFVLDDAHFSGGIDQSNPHGEIQSSLENTLSLCSFIEYVSSQCELNRNLKLEDLLKDISVIDENKIRVSLPKVNSEKDSVNLMTAHSSKGLEFEYVFIIKATDKNWGKTKADTSILLPEIYTEDLGDLSKKDLSLEDERRLFFVAITRAKEKVYFTYANEYITQGTTSSHLPTQFLTEISPDLLKRFSTVPKEGKTPDLTFNVEDYATKLKPLKNLDYSSEEKDFLKEQVAKFKLTPTALNLYLESPKRFKIEKLIRVPEPIDKHAALGTAVHYALEQMNRSYNEFTNTFSSLDKFLSDYEKSLKQRFIGEEEYEKTLNEGKEILKEYYEKVILVSGIKPALEVEYNFDFHNVHLIQEGIEPIRLGGRIDKIEKLGSESEGFEITTPVKVIDFKTKTPLSRNEILGETAKKDKSVFRQLVFYKLLGDLDDNFRKDRNRKNPKYNIEEVELQFIRPNKSGYFKNESFRIEQKDIDELKDLIIEVMTRIRNLDFPDESGLI